jgi:type I restriction-modification system DNA methylase subunit
LIALESPAFKRSYATHKKPEFLAESLIKTVSDELETANISGKKLENLVVQFSFIKTDMSLSKMDNVLKEIIDEIDANVNSFIKTHRYFDVLGQLYIEFLRYANSDKGLGIVLTPPHITEFFTDLACVNKNSIAYDNCTGTGGFLIAAMRRMIQDAKGDESKIKEIKSGCLIGAEYQSHIFALAVSNMYIHQDGKTSIINGDCFDMEVIKSVRAKKPTVGFLNPPYKSDKKKVTDELEFILNNLECLVDGGTCIAIVPMSCAIGNSTSTLSFKKKLLEKHTLEAVLSMPAELFTDSKVGEVTCIMIFSAHKPHPEKKETFFGYYKDDGFVKRKNKGRIDANQRWSGIKEHWITNFINRKNEAGLSINKVVRCDDEWSAEDFMETDYSTLTESDFVDTLHGYATFLFGNKLVSEVANKALITEKIKPDIDAGEYFKLTHLFVIKGSTTTPLLDLEEYGAGNFPYVTTQATNNGIAGFFDFFTE